MSRMRYESISVIIRVASAGEVRLSGKTWHGISKEAASRETMRLNAFFQWVKIAKVQKYVAKLPSMSRDSSFGQIHSHIIARAARRMQHRGLGGKATGPRKPPTLQRLSQNVGGSSPRHSSSRHAPTLLLLRNLVPRLAHLTTARVASPFTNSPLSLYNYMVTVALRWLLAFR